MLRARRKPVVRRWPGPVGAGRAVQALDAAKAPGR
jgi:hypothetical protein